MIEQLARILLDAGATPAGAASAAAVLDAGGSVAEALEALKRVAQLRVRPGDPAGELEPVVDVVDDLVRLLRDSAAAVSSKSTRAPVR